MVGSKPKARRFSQQGQNSLQKVQAISFPPIFSLLLSISNLTFEPSLKFKGRGLQTLFLYFNFYIGFLDFCKKCSNFLIAGQSKILQFCQ